MNDANLVMAKKKSEDDPEAGISEEQIAEIHRERKRKEKEKEKSMGCWDCKKKLSTWDYPLGIAHFGTNQKLGVVKKKVAGRAFLCFKCYKEAKKDREEIDEVGACFFCGKPGGAKRGCGVHLCEVCLAPITDIMSHGDGLMTEQEEIKLVADWWFTGRGLLSCLMELETFQRTENVKRLKELRDEIADEEKIGVITEKDHKHIIGLLDELLEEVGKDDGEPVEMAAGLYGTIEGLLMKALYHEHPMKKAEAIQLEPGAYELDGLRPEGLDTFRWTVRDGPVMLRKLPDEQKEEKEETPADDEAEKTKDD